MTDSALRALADRFGTPLYIFDDRALVQRVRYLREALPARVGICFAIKANPFVLPALEPLVDRLEVCSPGEYRICRALGLPHDKIVVSGVHKDIQTVSSAVSERQAPAAVTIESVSQLDLVLHQAATHSARVPVLLRLTSGNQFGMALPRSCATGCAPTSSTPRSSPSGNTPAQQARWATSKKGPSWTQFSTS